MGLFNFLKKKEEPHIRSFSSDANAYSYAEIKEWMEAVASNANLAPKAKSDQYVRTLFERIGAERDISILEDCCSDDVRLVHLAVERNGADYVSISYLLSDPEVVYITTAPFGFAGDCASFMEYCNRFQYSFPMISIGVRDQESQFEFEGEVRYKQPVYSVRTFVPLLGYDKDFENLLTIIKCLPIYGYDLRDGYQNQDPQPYASKQGINIQLEKIVKIHNQFRWLNDLYNAETMLYGSSPLQDTVTENPAVVSNPFLRELNMQTYPIVAAGRAIANSKSLANLDQESQNTSPYKDLCIYCYADYPCVYTLEKCITFKLENGPEQILKMLQQAGEFSFSEKNTESFGQYVMKMMLGATDAEDEINMIMTISFCAPNKVDAKNIAYGISKFLSVIAFSIESL